MTEDQVKFMIWDIAGGKGYRKVWHSYIPDADLIIFMIDGADFGKSEDVVDALREMTSDEHLVGKTVVCFVNKSVKSDH